MSAAAAAAKSLQSCLTLCNPIDGSPPGPAVPGILQARTLEWVAISSSNAYGFSSFLHLKLIFVSDIEKAREFQKNICFIDYTKASDCVDYKKLENC